MPRAITKCFLRSGLLAVVLLWELSCSDRSATRQAGPTRGSPADPAGPAAEAGSANPKAQAHLVRARQFKSEGNPFMATQEYHVSIDLDRGCYPCLLELGGVYLGLRQYDLALRALRRAAALRPSDPIPWKRLGDVFQQIKNSAEALTHYQKALQAGLTGPERDEVEKRVKSLSRASDPVPLN